MKKYLLLFSIIVCIHVQAHSQPLRDSLFKVKIDHSVFPLKDKFSNPDIIKPVYDGNKMHLLVSGFYYQLNYFEKSRDFDKSKSGPVILSYDSAATLLSVKQILSEQYNVIYIYKTQNTFLACGRYRTCNTDSCYTFENGWNHSTAFVAEFSEKFDLLKIKMFPGMSFWKLLKRDNGIYVIGEMQKEEINLNGKIHKSYIEIPKSTYSLATDTYYKNQEKYKDYKNEDDNEDKAWDYPDVVLLKLNKEFEAEKFTHFAIDGNFQGGESIVVNKNGYVAIGINTIVLRGPDHQDGNLYLVDSTFTMRWHKQYTDLKLGEQHATALNINEKNEVLSYVGSHYAMVSMVDSMLPDYSQKEKNKFPFEGVIVYNEKGKIKYAEPTKVPLALASMYIAPCTEIESSRPDEKKYIQFYKFENDSSVTLSLHSLSLDGKMTSVTKLPNKLPLLFYYNTSYDPHIRQWDLVSLRKY